MPAERERLVALLNELRTAEQAGAAALERWMATCRAPWLRGGLRVIRARDLDHAALAEARLVALGGVPGAPVPRELESLCGILSSPSVSDRSKLGILVARYPSHSGDPLREVVSTIVEDDETRALLETIGDDDRVSLGWLREAGDVDATVSREPGSRAVRFVDALRAAELAASDVVRAWLGVSRLAGLRGGLATIAAREESHGSLLAERLAELGGAAEASVPPALRDDALRRFGSAVEPDEDKLAVLLDRYPTDRAVSRPLRSVADDLADDPETAGMLGMIAGAEEASIGWLRAYREGMRQSRSA